MCTGHTHHLSLPAFVDADSIPVSAESTVHADTSWVLCALQRREECRGFNFRPEHRPGKLFHFTVLRLVEIQSGLAHEPDRLC